MQQSTSFNLDSMGNETMGGGGDMTIKWVEGGHGENNEMEDGRHNNNYFERERSKPSAMEGPKI
jgi:hypothetical protein